uniref:Uncharacterized protein n=1 Tax=Solanum tuberosum TaxID=4113 RepID=M1DAV2_SOLTU
MTTRRAQATRIEEDNVDQGAPPQAPVDLLVENVTNAEFRKCAPKNLSATLVGIADAFGDLPFGLLFCPSLVAYNIFVSWIIGRCSTVCEVAWRYADCSFSLPICSFPTRIGTLQQKANRRSIGDLPNGFGDSQIFISSFF